MPEIFQNPLHPDQPLWKLIDESPQLLLLLEHLGINARVEEKPVVQVCQEHQISLPVFLHLANLYRRNDSIAIPTLTREDVPTILGFLQACHRYYRLEKYPAIKVLIDELNSINHSPEMKLVEQFFDDYFKEVAEHLDYEDTIVFPWFSALAGLTGKPSGQTFQAAEYKDHHTDIESKLTDLKNLLLKYIPLQNDTNIRRKLLVSLYELEFDLNIHSRIEDTVLIPMMDRFEKGALRDR